MQAIMETAFDAVYLISVITIGIMMITKGKGNKEYIPCSASWQSPWVQEMPST